LVRRRLCTAFHNLVHNYNDIDFYDDDFNIDYDCTHNNGYDNDYDDDDGPGNHDDGGTAIYHYNDDYDDYDDQIAAYHDNLAAPYDNAAGSRYVYVGPSSPNHYSFHNDFARPDNYVIHHYDHDSAAGRTDS
jgi:hypothetical protein